MRANLQRQELLRRHSEHLENLPPERRKLFQIGGTTFSNPELLLDCLHTSYQLQRVIGADPDIKRVGPGCSSHEAYMVVILRNGADLETCRQRLPEFFRGYMLKFHMEEEA